MAGICLGRLHHALLTQVGERIDAQVGGDLSEAEPGSDQLVLGVGVDAVKTGVGDRRRTDPHVHFEGPGIAQGLHQLATGGAAHDRIVDHHHPLARQHIG